MKKLLILAITLFATASASFAQLVVPEREEYKLPNGLKVVFLSFGKVQAFQMRLVANSGKKNEIPGQEGINDLMAQASVLGTKQFSKSALQDTLYHISGGISAGAGTDFTTWTGSFLTQFTTPAIGIFSSVTINPTFPKEEVEQFIDEMATYNNPSRMDIGELASMKADEHIFGKDHPLGRNWSPEQLKKITSETLMEYYKFNVSPKNATLILCGQFDKNEARKAIEQFFGGWQATGMSNKVSLMQPAIKGKTLQTINRTKATQAYLIFTRSAPNRNAKDLLAFQAANSIFSDMLFKVVREQGGKTYGIGSNYQVSSVSNFIRIGTQVRNPEVVPTVNLVEKVMADMAAGKIDTAMFEGVKMSLRNSMISMETPGDVMDFYNPMVYDFEKRKQFLTQLEALTYEQVVAAAKKYFAGMNYTLTIAGDLDKIELPKL